MPRQAALSLCSLSTNSEQIPSLDSIVQVKPLATGDTLEGAAKYRIIVTNEVDDYEDAASMSCWT
jgi:hypothetical protein